MKKIALLACIGIAIIILSCGEGNIPSATEPLIELQAKYVTARPQLDGIGDDPVWAESRPFIVHFDASETGTKELNITFKAIWWKEWSQGNNNWSGKGYLGLLVSWPDDDKNIDKYAWHYIPSDSTWQRSREQSDWLYFRWPTTSDFDDVWLWDAALTNPLGYAEDAYIETIVLPDSTRNSELWIDGLNFFNDTATERNTYDINYDDNFTPRDSSDDRPKYAWKKDIKVSPPALPRIYSTTEDRDHFLMADEADFLKYTPYAEPTEAVMVPGYVLEDPLDRPADVLAAGTWSDGEWTVEIVRPVSTNESNDISLNPGDRWFSQPFYIWVGDNEKSPLETGIEDIKYLLKPVIFNFEYVAPSTQR